ncbi:MAG: hypothetical protein ACKVOK_12560 [Flavobacteriales bacterium]
MKRYPKSVKHLDSHTVFKMLSDFISASRRGMRTKKDGQRIRAATSQSYDYMQRLLQNFSNEKKFDLKLYLVNHLNASELEKAKKYWKQFHVQFTDYLYDDLNHYDNYVGQTIKSLRVFLNYVNQDLMLNVGQFHKKFHVPKEEIQIVVLSPTQLNYLIYDKTLDDKLNAELKVIKDIFVFGCTVALRFSDLMALQQFHLTRTGKDVYLKVRSQKTSSESNIKLPGYAVDILNKYKSRRKHILPQYSKGYFNKMLKNLSQTIEHNEPLIKVRSRRGKESIIFKNEAKRQHYTLADHVTSHTMRRTAITTMLRLGMQEQAVRRISGHAANSKEFFKYVSFSQSYIDSETDMAFERLSNLALK